MRNTASERVVLRGSTLTTMIRVDKATHQKLRSIASRTGGTMSQIVAAAVEEYDRKHFWEQVNEQYAALRENPQTWKDELEERALWDRTLSDGLDNEAT